MASHVDTFLSKALTERGYLSPETLDPVVMKAAQTTGGLASLLVKRGLVSEEIVLEILSEHFKLPKIDLAKTEIDPSLVQRVPLKFAEYYRFVPVKLENRSLTIAVTSPLDLRLQDEVRTQLGFEIQMVLARQEDISEAIKRWYGLGAGTIEKMATEKRESKAELAPEPEKVEEIGKLAEDASVIKLVNQILLDAHQKRATDIHIEPYRGKVKIRYRIDGVLYNTNVPSEIKKFILPIVSRIKIMANMNIIERRLPQDGRAIVKIGGETLDLRISSIPTPLGESIVIRLLPIARVFSLELLGLEGDELQTFQHLIARPHGIVFMTGPTGSGKSTTLYACLNSINTEDRKIITIEDPVEHEMEGITQIQVVPAIGLDFAKGLRSILRHDPDVIMVGEVRDLETAEIAARVALTGHLVFSTLHTNDSASGITRLIDIGVEPYLVASSVESFIAQRLVRMLCRHCKEEDKQVPEELKTKIAQELGLRSEKKVTCYRGKGCDKCNSTGFWGRVGIFELLLIDETIREMIMKRVSAGEITKWAVSKGMRTLRQSGWHKVIAGLTTPEEIMEVTSEEGIAQSPSQSFSAPEEKELQEAEEPRRIEKRNYLRKDIQIPILFHMVKSPSDLTHKDGVPKKSAMTTNFSAGGLLFTAPEKISQGSIVALRIQLPNIPQPIECLSRVVRVEEPNGGKGYGIAVCFLDLTGSDRTKLNQFVQEQVAEAITKEPVSKEGE